MRKLKNITISMLLVIVIAIGLSSAMFAITPRAGYTFFDSGDIYRYSEDEFDIPYLYAYATYKGHGLYYQFQTKMIVTFNGSDRPTKYGNASWSTSTATDFVQPCMPDDTYSWFHCTVDVK